MYSPHGNRPPRRFLRPRFVAAAGLALVVVIVPVVFGIVGGDLGALVGLGFSFVAVITALGAFAAYQLLRREAAAAEVRIRGQHETLTRRVAKLEATISRHERKVGRLVSEPTSDKSVATVATVRREQRLLLKQVQDIVNLFEMVPIRAGLPTLGRFTASADLLVELIDRFVDERPAVVVESGSGVSTLVLALAAREHEIKSRIIALDHDPVWADRTRELLARHGVAGHAEVRTAPLVPTSLEGHDTPWYDVSALADVSDIGMMLVDGPPGATGPRARFPMVPLLRDRFAHACTILVDDTDRPDDREMVDWWRPLLRDFTVDELKLDKGAMILQRK